MERVSDSLRKPFGWRDGEEAREEDRDSPDGVETMLEPPWCLLSSAGEGASELEGRGAAWERTVLDGVRVNGARRETPDGRKSPSPECREDGYKDEDGRFSGRRGVAGRDDKTDCEEDGAGDESRLRGDNRWEAAE